jgi:hypothetical protein
MTKFVSVPAHMGEGIRGSKDLRRRTQRATVAAEAAKMGPPPGASPTLADLEMPLSWHSGGAAGNVGVSPSQIAPYATVGCRPSKLDARSQVSTARPALLSFVADMWTHLR